MRHQRRRCAIRGWHARHEARAPTHAPATRPPCAASGRAHLVVVHLLGRRVAVVVRWVGAAGGAVRAVLVAVVVAVCRGRRRGVVVGVVVARVGAACAALAAVLVAVAVRRRGGRVVVCVVVARVVAPGAAVRAVLVAVAVAGGSLEINLPGHGMGEAGARCQVSELEASKAAALSSQAEAAASSCRGPRLKPHQPPGPPPCPGQSRLRRRPHGPTALPPARAL